jgi:peptidoglycan/LPS O-acetylase OafA/YrhL
MVVYHGVQQIGRPEAPFPRVSNPLSALVVEGHTAVALFMVLSGFILTYGADRSELRYGAFMKNRVLRVVPMYVVVVLVGLYTFPATYSSGGLLQFFTLQATPPLQSVDLHEWSAVLWTISVEFAFYLAFPFLLRFLQRMGLRYVFGLLLLTNVLRLMAAESNPASVRDMSYFTIVGRIDQFVLGMAAAWVLRRGMVRWRRGAAAGVCAAAFVGVCLALWVFNRNGSFFGTPRWKAVWPPLEGGLWALFVLAYVVATQGWAGRAARWLALPGVVSYSAYLLHYPLVRLVADRHWHLMGSELTNGAVSTLVLVLPATFALATLGYLVIERPFMQMRVRYLTTPTDAPG